MLIRKGTAAVAMAAGSAALGLLVLTCAPGVEGRGLPYSLVVEPVDHTVRPGEALELDARLHNASSREWRACVHYPRAVRFDWGEAQVTVEQGVPLHEVCASSDEFQLRPGKDHRWRHSVPVPQLAPGPAWLTYSVRVVAADPSRRPIPGTETTLTSGKLRIAVEGRPENRR